MLADPADQQRLLTLAELDSEIGRLQHTAKKLPQHARIAELMRNRQAVTDDLVAVTTRVGDLELSVRRAESDLVPVRTRLDRESKRVGMDPSRTRRCCAGSRKRWSASSGG